ncbi:MAG: hypothetical protein ACK559_14760, partial [bacterium]
GLGGVGLRRIRDQDAARLLDDVEVRRIARPLEHLHGAHELELGEHPLVAQLRDRGTGGVLALGHGRRGLRTARVLRCVRPLAAEDGNECDRCCKRGCEEHVGSFRAERSRYRQA